MTIEKLEKATFIECELSALLKAIDHDIRYAVYEEIDSKEYVRISYKGGGSRRICVTCDSILAIACDVLRGVE